MYSTKNNIKSWAEEDRPREKYLLKGKSALSDAELLAILINSGNVKATALDIAKEILAQNSNNLNELSKLSVRDLCKFNGIGQAKAVTLAAALELGRRRKLTEQLGKAKITTSKDAYDQLQRKLLDLDHEQFWMILLKKNLELIKLVQVSIGGVDGTVVDAKIVFKNALENLASNIILAHNHPSGNLKPSEADIILTQKLKKSGELMDIYVVDHIIFANSGYLSMADEGLL